MSVVPSSSATGNEDKIIIDSLPYVEAVHEDYEDYALALIEEEMQKFQPRPLKRLRNLNFRTPLMKEEYSARIVDGSFVPRPGRSYQPAKISRPSNMVEWRNIAIPQAKARLEAERIRGLVLEAEKEESVANWKAYTMENLENVQKQWSTTLNQQREAVEEVNYQRQQAQQQQLGPQLDQLNNDYQQMLYRRNQLEHAIEGIRRE